MIYTDHVPEIQNSGVPLANPFIARSTLGAAPTTAAIKEIPGLEFPIGTRAWGIEAWAKYALLGNYVSYTTAVFQNVEDQRFGVYDTESKTFCQLDLDPDLKANATVQWLSVADPSARRTRIFFEGLAHSGHAFGYVEGDLDNPEPCDPETGWVRRGFAAADLNAAARAAGQPDACPTGFCGFDGMTVLRHDDATNTDSVLLGNWGDHRFVVAQITADKQLHVPIVYVLPTMQPDRGDPAQPNACYALMPVGPPSVDHTRPANDVRFIYAFDKLCAPDGTPGCPPRAACEALPKVVSPAQEYSFDAVARTLKPTSFLFWPAACDLARSDTCEGLSSMQGGYSKTGDLFLSAAKTVPAGWQARIIRYPLVGGEHAFRDTTVTSASRDVHVVPAPVSRNYPLKTGGGFAFLSLPQASLEVENAMMILSKDTLERELSGFGTWTLAPELTLSLGVGAPAEPLPQESFVCSVPTAPSCTTLSDCPSGYACTGNTCRPITGCHVDADCPAGQTCPLKVCAGTRVPCQDNAGCASHRCVSAGTLGEIPPHNLALGGSPPSLWMSPSSGPAPGQHSTVNAYLTRIPVAVTLPGDHTTFVPPALAWSVKPTCSSSKCDRLWLIGAPQGTAAGTLRYRTRDQGLWSSSWSALPSNVAVAGGAAAVYTASNAELTDATVEVFARRQSDGTLQHTQLGTPIDCAPGTCSWTPWDAVPNAPVTDTEPAATIAALQNTAFVFVSVKDPTGQLWLNRRGPSGWGTWRSIPGLRTDGAPSLVFKADDQQVWLFARDREGGAIRYARVDGNESGAWATAGGAGAVLPWTTAPTASYTGMVRLLAGSGTFPSHTYQTTFSNGAWDAWRPIVSGAGTTRRPAAANANGDLTVITTYITDMKEQLVK